MREEEIISLIKQSTNNDYIGDDCAYLKELGIVVSQDNLIEDVHFSMDFATPYELGYKSGMVNISDISASGAIAKYITVGLALPFDITNDFIKEFYGGLGQSLRESVDIEIIGGDITRGDKIMISITIIGVTTGRKISSRSNAKVSHCVVVSGEHGSSGAGLRLLQLGKKEPKELIQAHLLPKAKVEFSKIISENIKEDYSMMDSSDGLVDSLFKLAQASDKTFVIDFEKVLYSPVLKTVFPNDYKDIVLYGGEDYQLVATVPVDFAKKYGLNIIGQVCDRQKDTPLIIENYTNKPLVINDLNKCYNHFS